ncbi:MAG: hypothetical protein WDN50_08950 [Bradyrhizobium sp.]
MNSMFRTFAFASVVCSLTEFAHAAPRSAPGPEIGDGMVGFTVAAVTLLTVLIAPRIKTFLQAKRA